jgi:hypothetical protein
MNRKENQLGSRVIKSMREDSPLILLACLALYFAMLLSMNRSELTFPNDSLKL